jgi:hypothetical protein
VTERVRSWAGISSKRHERLQQELLQQPSLAARRDLLQWAQPPPRSPRLQVVDGQVQGRSSALCISDFVVPWHGFWGTERNH